MCDGCEWEEALEMVDKLSDMVSEMPEAAEDFADSVMDKSESIGDWIAENEHVTDAQFNALKNMIAGAKRWII